MNSFICKVRTPQGQITKVKMQEKDKISCIKKLKRNGMTPISVEKRWLFIKTDNNSKKQKNVTAKVYSKKKKLFEIDKDFNIRFSNKVTIRELKKFTQEFYILKKSNFTNSYALSAIINNTNNEYFKQALRNLLKEAKSGKHLYKTMKKYNNIFPLVYINFIKTGELTGNLDNALDNAIKYLEDIENTRNKIKGEIIPSVIAFVSILFLIIVSLLFGIPSLQSIIESSNSNIVLPKITLFFVGIINNFIKYWYVYLAIFIGIVIIGIRYINTENGKYKIDYFKYSNFLFGRLIYVIEFSRLLKSVFLNLQNKMRIQDSLEIAKNFTSNTYMISKIEESISNIYLGKSWIAPFENNKFLNPIIIEMIKKGAKNKSLNILESAIEYTDKEIENETNAVLKKMPEILYIIVGIELIFFLIVFLIPCIHIYLSGLLFI